MMCVRSAGTGITSLKCFVVLMMYGVFSFLSFFIQPCPKNSLHMNGKEVSHGLACAKDVQLRGHSLIGDDLKHQVVQQSELLCNF